MARMIGAMAKGNIKSSERTNKIVNIMNEVILDPRAVDNFENAIARQSSKLLDMLVLYNEYTAEYTEIMSTVRNIRHSDEMDAIINTPDK